MTLGRGLMAAKTLSAAAALWFLVVVPCWYAWHYLHEPLNPYRHEYLQGVWISLVVLAPVALMVFLISRFLLSRRGM